MTFRSTLRRWSRSFRFWLLSIPVRAVAVFVHITVGFAFVFWGLETWTVWRIGVGVYVLYWVGLRYLGTIGLEGVYILNGVELDKKLGDKR